MGPIYLIIAIVSLVLAVVPSQLEPIPRFLLACVFTANFVRVLAWMMSRR